MLTINKSYQLFLESERQLLNEYGESIIINDETRSFFFDWVPSKKKVRNLYSFNESFFHLFCETPGFGYAYEVSNINEEGVFSHQHPSLFFRSDNGNSYSLSLTFQPKKQSITIYLSVYWQNRDGEWYSHSVDPGNLTTQLERWRESYQQAILSLPAFRLLDATGSLKIEHK